MQPAPLTPRDITVSLGMTWVDPQVINQFGKEVLGVANPSVQYSTASGQWTMNAPKTKYSRQTDSEWTHADRSAAEIMDSVLNNREIKITKSEKVDGSTRTYTDVAATTAVNEIAKKMRKRFSTWVWEDADRAETLAKRYNALRNRVIPRTFDGDFIDPPGLAIQFKPGPDGKGGLHAHQKRAIWRIVQTGTTYLAHAVGAGKTLEMIIGGMEMKRLGLISKPIYTVPNHVLGQFSTEFLEAYPTANIMVADEDSFTADKRKQFVAAATVNAPDAIIISHSALRLLRVKPETMQAVTDDLVADLEAAIEEADGDDRIGRKKLEAQLEKLQQRIEAKSDNEKQDDVVFFEDMGVDFMFVDEAHEFRKLDFVTNRTNVKGITPLGSAKALDLYAKTRYLHSQRPGRSHVMASGTPVTNTMGELYTVQKFLDYDAMREAGLHHFDAWASEYGEVATEYERNAAGQFKPVDRFAKFNNLPELMQQVRERMDVLTSTQLGGLVKRPDIDGGKPDMVVTAASKDLQSYMKLVLEPRIQASLKWKPSQNEPHNPDPMLAIIGDARLAVIDMRFVDPQGESDPASKLNVMIDRIIDKHGELSDIELVQPNGTPLPGKGATQIVFSPIGFGEGVAKRRGFSARDWMNKRFRDAGIPLEQVAWMSDYDTNRKRKAVFREMRAGRVRILIGSPANMGTGVNVQNRLNQLHFLSPPWFPSDVEQPHGRILRQGNLNPQVGLNWYVTEGTYDSTGWGMVARKGRFIEQVMTGDKSQRSAEDISEVSQYAMASALASGDDRAIRVAELEADIGRLGNLEGDHERMVRAAGDDIWRAKNMIESRTAKLAAANQAVEILGGDVIKADNLQLALNGKPVPGADRTEASQALMRGIFKLIPSSARLQMSGDGFEQQVGMVNGKYPIVVRARPGIGSNAFVDIDVMVGPVAQPVIDNMKVDDLPQDAAGALGITTRLMNSINGVTYQPERFTAEIAAARETLAKAEKRRGAPWPQAKEMFDKVAELANLKKEMADESAAAEASANATPTDQTQQPGDQAPAASQPEPAAVAAREALGVNDLTLAMQKIVRGWKGDAPKVLYVQTAAELPAAAKRGEWFNAEGWYNGKDTIYLVADNLPNVTRAEQVLAHEAFGHYGVESITGKSAWAQIVADVARLRSMKGLGKEMKGALASAERRYGNESPVQFARELLAVMAERGIRSSMLGRLLAAVRRWARGLGFRIDNWAEDELRAVVARGIRSVEQGGGGGGSRGTRGAAFSAPESDIDQDVLDEILQEHGQTIDNSVEADKLWSDGWRIFGMHEQDEGQAYPIRDIEMLRNHAVDHLLAVKPAVFDAALAEIQGGSFSLKDPGGAIDNISAALANPKKLATDKLADWKPSLLALLTLDQLAEISKDETPQVKGYAKAVLKMQTRRNQLQEGAAKIADAWQEWQRANREEAEVLTGVMHDATIAGVDPAEKYVPGVFALHTGESVSLAEGGTAALDRIDLLKASAKGKTDVINRLRGDKARLMAALETEKARERSYPMLVARFNRLSPEAKGLYRDVRDEYANRSEATMVALLERIGVLGLPDEQKASLSAKIRTMFESARVTAPYFPLARFGEYWVSAVKTVDGEEVKSFHMAETKAERDKLVEDLKAEGFRIAARGVKLDTVKASDGASGQFVAEVIDKLNLAGVDDKVQDEIYQLYLRTLPDLSVRKNFIHRKKVAGYAADALRAFAGHMNHGAHQLARLENSRFLEAEIDGLKAAAKGAANEDTDAADRMGRMYNELQKRHEWVMNPNDSALVQKISSANFIFYLGVSPAAAAVNLMQSAAVTLPALGARHGAVRALKEMSRAMADAIRTGGNIQKAAATEQERQALQALQDMGAIDKTLAHDLAGIGDADSRDFSPLWRKTMKVVSYLFHKTEVINREASGLAAFRMAIEDGKTFEQAVDAAAEIIHETHFNYSNANRARFMQGNAAKILFAFKQYSQNMTFFLWRNFYQTMKGATTEERNEARRKLIGTIGMTALFSGLMGVPLLSVGFGIANAMAAAFGDDDEPWDAETEFRNFLADTLGPEVGRIAQVGVLQGGLSAMGLPAPSISERISLNNLWFRDPDQELEGRALYNYWLEQAAGPVGGMFGSALSGYGLIKEGLEKGDPGFLWRGVESAMPKFVKDAMRSVRYATEGVNTLRGDPLIEDTSLGEWFIQANGFTPARVTEAYEVNRAVKGYEKKVMDRRGALLDAYALAQRQGDTETQRAVLAKIRTFNSKHRGLTINMGTIRRSLASRQDFSDRAINGIVVSNKVPEAREQGRFFAPEE